MKINLESKKILCVIVTEGNRVRNRIINVDQEMNSERVLKLNLLFNSTLIGLTYQDINLAIVSQITNQGGEDATIVRDILDVIGLAVFIQYKGQHGVLLTNPRCLRPVCRT